MRKKPQRHLTGKQSRWLHWILNILLICIVIYIVWYWRDSAESKKVNLKLQELREETGIQTDTADKTAQSVSKYDEAGILKEYSALYKQNEDLKGWIEIPDTAVSYPVLQAQDNAYYLTRDFYGANDRHGSIFVDCETDGLDVMNVMLYGHHMKDGTMFADLEKYEKEEFFEKHRYIQFDTLRVKRTYEILAVFQSRIFFRDEEDFRYYQYKNMKTEEEFQTFYTNVKKLSIYDTKVTATAMDELITLSTCNYNVENGRFVVVAKRIE